MTAGGVTRSLIRILFTAAWLGVVVVAGQWPMGEATGEAVLRVSLRSTRARAEVCRERTPEELAALPIHMREPRICETFAPPYRLTVAIDGEPRLERSIAPGGVKGDRPLIASVELALDPGTVDLDVRWSPELDGLEEFSGGDTLPKLPRFELRRRVELFADRIALVELDEASGEMRLVGSE
jgi:hypothetical protein